MRENETMAYELVAALSAVGIESRVDGGCSLERRGRTHSITRAVDSFLLV